MSAGMCIPGAAKDTRKHKSRGNRPSQSGMKFDPTRYFPGLDSLLRFDHGVGSDFGR